MSAFIRPKLTHVSATKIATNEEGWDYMTRAALKLADDLRARGYKVTVENVDDWEGPAG